MNTHSLAGLIAMLKAQGLSYDAIGLAEVLWLSRWLSADAGVRAAAGSDTESTAQEPLASGAPHTDSGREESQLPPAPVEPPKMRSKASRRQARIYPSTASASVDTEAVSASAVRIVAAPALPGALDLGRALRPLISYRNSRSFEVLDEEETAEASAVNRRLMPVFRPLREPLFDVALVVDDSPAMAIWRKTIDEFQRLLERHGAFRDVRRWRLALTPEIHLTASSGMKISPKMLCDPAGHRLIIVFTQGTHAAWSRRQLTEWLWNWAGNDIVVVAQPLPEPYWQHTKLGEASSRVKSQQPAGPNSRLILQESPWWYEGGPHPLAVPVFALEPDQVAKWANMVMAARGADAPAFLFEPPEEVAGPTEQPVAAGQTAEQLLSQFQTYASEEAVTLLYCLSQITFTLPVMRLVQQAVCGKRASQTHLAEVLLSGLVERVTQDKNESRSADADPTTPAQADAEQELYQVRAEIRKIAPAKINVKDALNIVKVLSRYIEERLGETADLTVVAPDIRGDRKLPSWVEPFAIAREELAQQLGLAAQGDEEQQLLGIRILWVDDNPRKNSREATNFRNQGALVSEVLTTSDALRKLEDQRYDVIISDMGRGDQPTAGLDLLLEIKKRSLPIPVIVYAGRWVSSGGREIALQEGAFGCTNQTDELFTLVLQAIAKGQESSDDPVKGPELNVAVPVLPEKTVAQLPPPAQFSRIMRLADQRGVLRRIAWSRTGLLAAGGFDGNIRIWNLSTGQWLRSLQGHHGSVYSVAWDPQSGSLASGSADGSTRIWDVTSGICEHVFELHAGSVFGLAWSPASGMIAGGTDSGTVYVWTATDRKLRKIYQHSGAVHSVAWSPDGQSLASASNDGTVRISNLSRESEAKLLVGHEIEVYAVAWSPDGRLIASSGTDQSIRLWDHATGADMGTLRGHERHITDLAFSADGLLLASISWDHSVCVWNMRSLDLMSRLSVRSAGRFHSGLVFNPMEGHALALVSEAASAIEVWEPENEHIFAREELSKDKYAPLLETGDLEQFLGAAESVGIARERLEKLLNAGPHHLASEIIDRSPDQNGVFRSYLTLIQAFTGSPWLQMLLLRENELVVVAERIDRKLQDYRYPVASWSGVIGYAAKTVKTFWAPDVATTPNYIGVVPGTKSELAMPLRTSRQILGVVNIEWNVANAIPARKIQWLEAFCQPLADQLAKRIQTIFISYPAQDSSFAYKLAQNIRDAGGSPWLDQEQLRAGGFESVLAAIQHSGTGLFLMSKKSAQASLLEPEFDFAFRNQSFRIYPILIEDCPIPAKLRAWQYFDFRKNYSEGLVALFATLDLPFTSHDDAQDNNVVSQQLHPEEDAANRGKLTPCSFVIHPKFMTHGAKRWKKWADLLVRLDHTPRQGYVYLIPSSSAPRELRDPGYLSSNTNFLELKRQFTKEFADLKRGAKLQGFWFYKSMRESATIAIQVYSEEYDKFLVSRLRSQSSFNQAKSTKASKTLPYALVNVLCPEPVTFKDDPNERHGPYVRSRGKHRLDVPMSFQMGIYPVTNALYLEFVEDGGYSNTDLWDGNSTRGFLTLDKKTRGPGIWLNSRAYPLQKENHPVTGISFLEATAFVKWLQLREPSNGWVWCLPTEDMWELAARSSEGFQYPWGQGFAANHCNSLEAGFGDTTEAGRFPEGNSSFGCADMAGNVWEFVTSLTTRSPVSCVLRGGSFHNNEYEIKSYLRLFGVPIDLRPHDFGFRCAQISVADYESTRTKQKRIKTKKK